MAAPWAAVRARGVWSRGRVAPSAEDGRWDRLGAGRPLWTCSSTQPSAALTLGACAAGPPGRGAALEDACILHVGTAQQCR